VGFSIEFSATYALPKTSGLAGCPKLANWGIEDILNEVPELALILHLDQLLRAVRRVRNVQLSWGLALSTTTSRKKRKTAFCDANCSLDLFSLGNGFKRTFIVAVFADDLPEIWL